MALGRPQAWGSVRRGCIDHCVVVNVESAGSVTSARVGAGPDASVLAAIQPVPFDEDHVCGRSPWSSSDETTTNEVRKDGAVNKSKTDEAPS